MKNKEIINQNPEESFFDVNELFISRTDGKGIIISGNDVFTRVSGYSKEELIGEPHNIIRHPDMPKAVFRLLWNTIKAGNVIAAYVKNQAKDGRYYWVLATVFPVTGGYLSIRMKPTSELVKAAESIYKEVLSYEKEKGIDASLEYTQKLLKDAGFPTYLDFMHLAMKTEMEKRDQFMATFKKSTNVYTHSEKTSSLFNIFLEMQESISQSSKKLADQFFILSEFEQLKIESNKNEQILLNSFEKLECLAVNMSISAHKLGKEGSTLAIVANNFQQTAKQVINQFSSFQEIANKTFTKLNEVSLGIICSRIQAEMLSFHISEVIEKINSGVKTSKKDKTLLLKDFQLLIASAKDIFEKSNEAQNTFYKNILQLKKEALQLHQLITRLDLIKTGGRLEGSRTSDISDIFKPFVNEMGHFVNTVEEPIAIFNQKLSLLLDGFKQLNLGFMLLEHSFTEIDMLIKFANETDDNIQLAG